MRLLKLFNIVSMPLDLDMKLEVQFSSLLVIFLLCFCENRWLFICTCPCFVSQWRGTVNGPRYEESGAGVWTMHHPYCPPPTPTFLLIHLPYSIYSVQYDDGSMKAEHCYRITTAQIMINLSSKMPAICTTHATYRRQSLSKDFWSPVDLQTVVR